MIPIEFEFPDTKPFEDALLRVAEAAKMARDELRNLGVALDDFAGEDEAE